MPEDSEVEGTVLSKMKPVVTMLTETLVRDFIPGYRYVNDEQLQEDVEAWLMGLEEQMDNESDRKYAQVVTHMVRKNKGWVTLLSNRVKKRLEQ